MVETMSTTGHTLATLSQFLKEKHHSCRFKFTPAKDEPDDSTAIPR